MTFASPARHSFLALFLVLACLTPAGAATSAPDNAPLVARARDQIQNEHFMEGLASAREAARKNPQDYKASYYVALASLALGRFDDADAAVARARALAPDSARDSIDHLQASIKGRRDSLGTLQAADAALAEGLVGKAAGLYDQAWEANRTDARTGFKAADLYGNRLGQPVDAARILRVLLIDPKNSSSADTQLANLTPALRQVATTNLARGDRASGAQRRKFYRDAFAADPDSAEAGAKRARAAAADGDGDELKSTLKNISARGKLELDVFSGREFGPWLSDSRFLRWLTDLIGASMVAKVQEDVAAARARESEIADAWVWKDDTWSDFRKDRDDRSLEREQARCDGHIQYASQRARSAKEFDCQCGWENHPAYGDYASCRLTWTENTILR